MRDTRKEIFVSGVKEKFVKAIRRLCGSPDMSDAAVAPTGLLCFSLGDICKLCLFVLIASPLYIFF